MPGTTGSWVRCEPVRTAPSREAASASTSAPTGTSGARESITRPTAPPCIVAPTSQACVGRARPHPAAHVGIDRHDQHPDEDLPLRRVGALELHQPEVLRRGYTVRPGRELPFTGTDGHPPILHGAGPDRSRRGCGEEVDGAPPS